MGTFLQLWGGSCYLINKILLALGAKKRSGTKYITIAWAIYIAGVPAWVIILMGHGNWIAVCIEAGGVPAMVLGLINSLKKRPSSNILINNIVSICTYGSLVIGVSYSLLVNNGINSITQILEIGVIVSFLLGSYNMAKSNLKGWIFFMSMNINTAILMFIQEEYFLTIQQLISLGFVVYGYTSARSHSVLKATE